MLDSKTSFRLAKGDRVVMSTGGGAGYGEPPDLGPAQRSRERPVHLGARASRPHDPFRRSRAPDTSPGRENDRESARQAIG